MKCPKCGETIRKNSKFCNKCGEKIESKQYCINCGKEVSIDDKICPECGKNIKTGKKDTNILSGLDFNSYLITIPFLVCSLLSIILFRHNGLFTYFLGDNTFITSNIIGIILIIIGIILFIINIKNINIKESCKSILKLKPNITMSGIILIITGLLIIIFQTSDEFNIKDHIITGIIGFINGVLLFISILLFNLKKLIIPYIFLTIIIIITCVSFFTTYDRYTNKAIKYLEKDGYTCENTKEYEKQCTKKSNDLIKTYKFEKDTEYTKPEIELTIDSSDEYSFSISEIVYTRRGGYVQIFHNKGSKSSYLCYYYPTRMKDIKKWFESDEYLEIGEKVQLWVDEDTSSKTEKSDEKICPDESSLVNKSLREYEELLNHLNIKLKTEK